jgi:hypothetical protein
VLHKIRGGRVGKEGEESLDHLLDACETLAFKRRLQRLVAGLNLARGEAFQRLSDRGFRPEFQGVAMERPNNPGYNRPHEYLIDDWR